ncbi:MAG TPA: M28 family peptidase [Gemmatimonadaceae bacterium]|jgi:hypothetical protein|nr:M28 family peptidase [Gemmatimonadaceae bacterium]
MIRRWSLAASLIACIPLAASAQGRGGFGRGMQGPPSFPTDDPVIKRIWAMGMDSSHTTQLAQALMDSIGPRLTGSPGHRAGNDWLVSMYKSWGIDARNEQYGTWMSWKRGVSHIDLISPRVRSLEGTMLAWSPGTNGKDVDGDVVILPDVPDSNAFVQWLPNVKGKYVLVSPAQPSCRPDDDWAASATPAELDSIRAQRTRLQQEWRARVARTGYGTSLGTGTLGHRLEEAGAVGVIENYWSNGWGVDKVFNTRNTKVPGLDLSCEDYGLVYRLAEHNQHPRLRVHADAEFEGTKPVFNTIAVIPGTEKPDEYVMLSAHFDSWDGGSGATDNGTGTITMLEAMRILKQVYPHPKRTIIVGHWGGEEEGLIGSTAFAADHPEIVKGLQVLLNQDNGTGRVVNSSAGGLIDATSHVADWFSRVPDQLSGNVKLSMPGSPGGGGSDHASFACKGALAVELGSLSWNYGIYTWHTNRDTYDKIVFDEVKANATLTAMLAYEASEDPQSVPREQRVIATNPRTGQPGTWPACEVPLRTYDAYKR